MLYLPYVIAFLCRSFYEKRLAIIRLKTVLPKAPPLRKDFPRPGEDVAQATKRGIWRVSA
jgi:hypothetical protein